MNMPQFAISAKFLGTQVEFGLPNSDMYTLAEIWADVYMFTCSSIPSPDERFKAEVKLPWNGEYKLIQNDDDMQGVFREFKERSLETIRFNFDLLPNTSPTEIVDLISDDDDAVYQPPNLSDILSDGDEDYSPATDIIYSTDNDHSRDSLMASEEIQLEDDVEKDTADNGIPDTNSHMSKLGRSTGDNSTEEDQLSNAASLKFDQFDMMDNNSDEDEGISRHVRNRRGVPYKEADNGRVVLEVGYLFNNLHHFRQVLRDFVVQEGFQLRRIKNDKDRYTAVCAYEGCSWRIHASPVEDRTTFMIKTLHPRHCCQKVHKNQEATASWVANRFKALIEENPDIKVKFLAREVHRIYGLNLPAYTLYRAKNRVLNKTDKENEESYDMLYSYGFMIRERNPGSMAYLQTISPDLSAPARFQRFFLSFEAQKAGYIFGCRPFIGLDGCHLKGKHPGVLLCAIAMDANFGIFPVAVCVCEGESKESWGWFLHHLYMHIGMEDNRRVTFMSDRQKGVIDAIQKFWPRSSNRFCVRHLIANMQAKYRGQLSGLFVWNASNKSTKAEFKEEISKLREVNEDAYNYMMGIPLQHWALHAFDYHVKSEHTTNNLSECFNGWVDKYRAQPTLSLMESIRRKVMRRMNKRLEDARNWSSVLPPLVNKKLVERQDEARFVDVLCASDNEYEVRDGIKFYIVNLETQSCDCCLWELSGIPCKHAMAVINAKRMKGQDFVNGYLTKEAYMRTYNNVIHPIPDQAAWPTIKPRKVLPPLHKRMPGRPKKNRKRGPEEGPKQKRSGGVKCRGCGEFGHNIRTCKAKDGGRGNQTNAGTNKVDLSARKRHFETGSCSTSTTKRRVQVQLHVREGLSQNATRNRNYNTAGEQASLTVEGSFSQPMTTSAPLHLTCNATQPTQSRADPGTVAGLDIDWSGLF